jgi:hypothetical protein
MAITVSAEDIVRNPAWHLYDIDLQRKELHFLEVTPQTFGVSAFLDNRIAYTTGQMHGFGVDAVISAFRQIPPQSVGMNFLFHSSFCCSSLLARSLQLENQTLVLREPWVLRRLADTRRTLELQGQAWNPQGSALIDMALTLLGKTWVGSESVLIKPTNVANNLCIDMLAMRPAARGILLYSDLESFLISNLKKSEETKQKMPALARIFNVDIGYVGLFEHLSIESLGFLQTVVVVWHAQMLAFQRLLASDAGPRLATLDSGLLLKEPEQALAAAAGFLGYALNREQIVEILAGPTWNTHAKDPFSVYGRDMREQESSEIAAKHSAEILYVLRWAEKLFERHPPGLPLSRSLVTAD